MTSGEFVVMLWMSLFLFNVLAAGPLPEIMSYQEYMLRSTVQGLRSGLLKEAAQRRRIDIGENMTGQSV